jgi:hypothetical protein
VRILLFLVAVICILAGVACGAPALVTYRSLDRDGYINGNGHMATGSAAFVVDTAEFKDITEEQVEEGRTGGDTRLRIRAERTDGGEVIVGIASAETLQTVLVTGSFELVSELEFEPFAYAGVGLGGVEPLTPPEQGLFASYAAGSGAQEITWTVEPGEWRVIIMNSDGSPRVDVDVRFGARFPYLRGFAIAGMAIGSAILLLGLVILVVLFRPRRRKKQDSEPADEGPGAVESDP